MRSAYNELFEDETKNIPLNVELANVFGITSALIIAYFIIETESCNPPKTVFRKGRMWCTETYEHMTHGTFPFLSTRTIERAVKKLEDQGVLLSEIFGNYKMDRTKSYAVDTDRLFEILGKGRDE